MSGQERGTRERTGALAHFIISNTNPAELGKTKLFKTMWHADVLHYRRYGETISGLTAYMRMQNGPVPGNIYRALEDLKARGKISERSVAVGDFARHEFIRVEQADPDWFTSRERQSIYRAIKAVRPLTAAQASDMTHDILWQVLENGEDMSIRAAAVIPGDVTPEDMELVLKHKECFEDEHIETAERVPDSLQIQGH